MPSPPDNKNEGSKELISEIHKTVIKIDKDFTSRMGIIEVKQDNMEKSQGKIETKIDTHIDSHGKWRLMVAGALITGMIGIFLFILGRT